MPITRRSFLKGTAAAGALTLGRPWAAFGDTLQPATVFATSRQSRLFPGTGLGLVHCDMHNHTVLSDGDGDPALAFESMRTGGLDVAALTDHATIQYLLPVDPCAGTGCGGEEALAGINEARWQRMKDLADLANRDGSFVALRGFEWSSPFQGHMNVWFSERWIDPLATGGATTGEGAAGFLHEEGAPIPPELVTQYNEIMKQLPTTGLSMAGFYAWLAADPARPILGGGRDGIASFNHPGREPGRFGYFSYKKSVAPQVVAMEIFNRRDDYLFRGTDIGDQSPLNECLNAGWKVGLSGVTDEHGTAWGHETGKGRMGLWVSRPGRKAIRDALVARRFFATRLSGLRVDAAARSRQMGQALTHRSGPVTFRLDIDRGTEWWGKPLSVQVLRPGTSMPTLLHAQSVVVPADSEPLISFTVPINIDDGTWVVLRISDPSEPADGRADATWAPFGNAVAYTSPWYLQP